MCYVENVMGGLICETVGAGRVHTAARSSVISVVENPMKNYDHFAGKMASWMGAEFDSTAGAFDFSFLKELDGR